MTTRSSLLSRVAATMRAAAWEPISPAPLALYRIAFAVVVLCELLQIVHRRDLIFLPDPLHGTIPPTTIALLWVWFAAVLFQAVGFLTPLSALVNYRCIVHFMRPDAPFSYHADMLYVPAALLLIVLPTYRVWSIDAVLVRRWFRIDLGAYPIPRLFNNITILWVMGFMYIDSTHFKLESAFWREGLGFWLPASFPSFTTFSWSWLLDHELLVKLAGYVTLGFELVFIFVFWIPRARIFLVAVGLVLHLGIAIVFPIPLFGLLVAVMYLNFFPDTRLARVLAVVRLPSPGSHAMPRSDFLPFDRSLARILLIVLVPIMIIQASITLRSPLYTGSAGAWIKDNLGLTQHQVFSTWAFTAMKREVAIVHVDRSGTETWIPWVGTDGHVGSEAYGRFWSTWWNNALPHYPGQEALWARAAESWLLRNDISPEDSTVIVRARPVDAPRRWELGRQQRMEDAPWKDIAWITWPGGVRRIAPMP